MDTSTLPLTDDQARIAEGLGWSEEHSESPFRELLAYIERKFSGVSSSAPVSFKFPDNPTPAGVPLFAAKTQFTLAVTREFVDGKPTYKGNYSELQASVDYQETLRRFLELLTRGREVAVFCRVTEIPKDFDSSKASVMTCCSAECDIFIPTGLSRGINRRDNSHTTDQDLFSFIVSDYIKVMSKIQKRGYSLCAHFYLVRADAVQQILLDRDAAELALEKSQCKSYRKLTIGRDGEIILTLDSSPRAKRGKADAR